MYKIYIFEQYALLYPTSFNKCPVFVAYFRCLNGVVC